RPPSEFEPPSAPPPAPPSSAVSRRVATQLADARRRVEEAGAHVAEVEGRTAPERQTSDEAKDFDRKQRADARTAQAAVAAAPNDVERLEKEQAAEEDRLAAAAAKPPAAPARAPPP